MSYTNIYYRVSSDIELFLIDYIITTEQVHIYLFIFKYDHQIIFTLQNSKWRNMRQTRNQTNINTILLLCTDGEVAKLYKTLLVFFFLHKTCNQDELGGKKINKCY